MLKINGAKNKKRMVLFDWFKKKSGNSFKRINLKYLKVIGIATQYKGRPFTGVGFSTYENGILEFEQEYVDGLKHGYMRTYNEVGKLDFETEFQYNDVDGTSKTYYKSGQLHSEKKWTDGKQNGVAKTFYKSGQLQIEENFVNGKPLGESNKYYNSGEIKEKITWVGDGNQTYNGKIYNKSGDLIDEVMFIQGGLIGYKLTQEILHGNHPDDKPLNEFGPEYFEQDKTRRGIMEFNLFGINVVDTFDGFLEKLDYYDSQEIETDNFLFDYAANGYNAIRDDDGWTIIGGGVNSAAKLISEYDPFGSYVLEQAWSVIDYSTDLIEVCFLNCKCPGRLNKYYGDGLFVTGPKNKLVEATSDYFKKISKTFFEGKNIIVESDAEAQDYSDWPKKSYGPIRSM